tara:strand:- start:354 stop:611 length:258 start_codon:yes stop_codon:yes gene_type:complete
MRGQNNIKGKSGGNKQSNRSRGVRKYADGGRMGRGTSTSNRSGDRFGHICDPNAITRHVQNSGGMVHDVTIAVKIIQEYLDMYGV